MKNQSKYLLEIAILAMLTVTGCESMQREMKAQADADKFPLEDDNRPYRRVAIMQTAVGARRDGMLYDYHFDGDSLNSLGREKLSCMLQANDHDFPLKVYMNFPEETHVANRKQSVSTYLIDSGLRDNQVAYEYGFNPKATSSASKNLARISKTESESPVASNPTNPTGGTPAASGADYSGGGAK